MLTGAWLCTGAQLPSAATVGACPLSAWRLGCLALLLIEITALSICLGCLLDSWTLGLAASVQCQIRSEHKAVGPVRWGPLGSLQVWPG
eukprot:14454290-Alexandrium_andersonii.AAC.1